MTREWKQFGDWHIYGDDGAAVIKQLASEAFCLSLSTGVESMRTTLADAKAAAEKALTPADPLDVEAERLGCEWQGKTLWRDSLQVGQVCDGAGIVIFAGSGDRKRDLLAAVAVLLGKDKPAEAQPDYLHVAMRKAAARFGGNDGTFNAANLANVLREEVPQTLDGNMVSLILRGRNDVRELPGRHFRLLHAAPGVASPSDESLPCPEGFRRTGERRKPKKGEWYLSESGDTAGQAWQAHSDFLYVETVMLEPIASPPAPAGDERDEAERLAEQMVTRADNLVQIGKAGHSEFNGVFGEAGTLCHLSREIEDARRGIAAVLRPEIERWKREAVQHFASHLLDLFSVKAPTTTEAVCNRIRAAIDAEKEATRG